MDMGELEKENSGMDLLPKFFEARLHGDGFKCQVPGPHVHKMNFRNPIIFAIIFLTSPLAMVLSFGHMLETRMEFLKIPLCAQAIPQIN